MSAATRTAGWRDATAREPSSETPTHRMPTDQSLRPAATEVVAPEAMVDMAATAVVVAVVETASLAGVPVPVSQAMRDQEERHPVPQEDPVVQADREDLADHPRLRERPVGSVDPEAPEDQEAQVDPAVLLPLREPQVDQEVRAAQEDPEVPSSDPVVSLRLQSDPMVPWDPLDPALAATASSGRTPARRVRKDPRDWTGSLAPMAQTAPTDLMARMRRT